MIDRNALLVIKSKLTCILVTVSIAVMKHHDQKASCGKKGVFGLHFHITSSLSLKEVRAGAQAGTGRQELMKRPWGCC